MTSRKRWVVHRLKNVTLVGVFLSRIYLFKLGRRSLNGIARWVGRRHIVVSVRDLDLSFVAGLGQSEWRARTLATKEPETLDFIDAMSENSVFWDIGSSTGIYSIYAARKRNCQVVTIEPNPSNGPIITENIRLNQLNHLITPLTVPLMDRPQIVGMQFVSDEIGSSQHQVVATSDIRGVHALTLRSIALSLDLLVNECNLPAPSYVKLDIDGLEHLVLVGAQQALRSVVAVIVEKQTNVSDREKSSQLLRDAGLKLILEGKSNTVWKR